MIIKTLQNRVATLDKQLENLEDRAAPLLKEKAKIEALLDTLLEDEAHEANAKEMCGSGKKA